MVRIRTGGFTLLELLVVLGLLGLMSTLAAEYLVDDVSRKRRSLTAQRIAAMHYAAAGNHSRTLNAGPALRGWIADTGVLPKYVRDRLSNRYRTSVRFRAATDRLANGFEWREAKNWKGPYPHPTTSEDVFDQSGSLLATIPVFRDARGNRSPLGVGTDSAHAADNLNFGWTSRTDADGLYCLRATYRNGWRVFVDLGTDTVIPAAPTSGTVVIDGFRKNAASASCKSAAYYQGIQGVEFFAHNAFGTDQVQATIN